MKWPPPLGSADLFVCGREVDMDQTDSQDQPPFLLILVPRLRIERGVDTVSSNCDVGYPRSVKKQSAELLTLAVDIVEASAQLLQTFEINAKSSYVLPYPLFLLCLLFSWK